MLHDRIYHYLLGNYIRFCLGGLLLFCFVFLSLLFFCFAIFLEFNFSVFLFFLSLTPVVRPVVRPGLRTKDKNSHADLGFEVDKCVLRFDDGLMSR